MKFFLKPLFFLAFFSCITFTEMQAQSTNGEGDPNGRHNWFPNRGNVGIGTRDPSEDLEVIGNIKVTSTLFADTVQTVGLKAGKSTFLDDVVMDQNLTVQGKVGIGIPNPTERFEVEGNGKFSQAVLAADGNFSNNVLIGGNIGIGVSEPTERIEVEGNIKASGNLIGAELQARQGLFSENVTIDGTTYIKGNLGLGVATPAEKLEVDGNIKTTANLIGNELQAQQGAFSENVTIGGTTFINGNVGLGVESPAEKLEVAGNMRATGNLMVEGNAEVVNSLTVYGAFNAPNFSPETLEVGSLTVANELNINTLSIGTSVLPDNFKLAVQGNIIATGIDIKIPEKWPDYVFTNQHNRLTLEELQQFVDTHGHLPGFQSAKEMEAKEHYNIGEMNMKLLEKIEELSLYVLELKEEIEALKKSADK